MSGSSVSASVLVLTLLPVAVLAQTQCSLPGSEEPQHGNYIVQPILECRSDGLSFQLNYSYPDDRLVDSSMQMFYECTDVFGNVTNELIYWAYDRMIARSPRWALAYPVGLSSSFIEPGTSCRVYGCYRPNTIETINHYLIQNATCQYPDTTMTTTPIGHTPSPPSYTVSPTLTTTPTEPAPSVQPTGHTPSFPPFTVSPTSFAQCRHSSLAESLPQDGDYYVYPNLTCTDTGLTFQLMYNYDANQIVNSRIQLFYQCTDAAGRIITRDVPNSRYYQLDSWVYSVPLSSTFIEPGGSCQVYGCYQLDSGSHYQIKGHSCQFGTTRISSEISSSSTLSDHIRGGIPYNSAGIKMPHSLSFIISLVLVYFCIFH